MPGVPNQLHRELLSINGLNPWVGHDSSARQQMFSSHLSQSLVVQGATERRCQTGMEDEYGKYTFNVKMPCDAHIIKIVERYPRRIGPDCINVNPETVILFEDYHTKEVGILSLRDFCSNHPYFGFEYKKQAGLSLIRPDSFVPKDTKLLDSPSITPDGGYKFGVECNMAYMTHPATSEDGILISRDVLHRFKFKTYETRVVEWGTKRFPLNLYGDDENFKAFPDIGERIREDGVLMCLRAYDPTMAIVEQNAHSLKQIDFVFDKLTYANGAGGRVVDIRIFHDIYKDGNYPECGMDVQPKKYDNARRVFYQEIVNEVNRLTKQRGASLRLSKELQRFMIEAKAVLDNDQQQLQKLYRQAPLDDWRVEFVIEYEITPNIGFKLTGGHGNKGVVCHIAEPHEMPVDSEGNRADIVMDPFSIVSRMNLGCLYEQYINAASRDVSKKIRSDLGVSQLDTHIQNKLKELPKEQIEKAWQYLMGYYQIVSPRQHRFFTEGAYKGTLYDHLESIIRDGVYLYLPTDNEPESTEIIKQLETYYSPCYGPVVYTGYSGRQVITRKPVRIGSAYILLLEKIADDWTAVSSGKLQHFGVLSQVTNQDKYAQPSRQQAIRAYGESEVRIYVAYAGAKITADIMDRNNNPNAHRAVCETILNSDTPTHIGQAVDRNKVPIGGSKALALVNHILLCSGVRMVYRPHIPNYELSDQQK